MGSFKQHVTCSTVTGIVLGGLAYQSGFPLPTCLLAGGLCSMAGMLPDIDSDTSRSFQECIYIAAAMCAFLLVQRLRAFDTEPDIIMLGGAGMFLFVRFVVGEFIKKTTVHRGMYHSIPAAIFAGQITFFISTGAISERLLKASALTAGYLSHLLLDEVFSIDSTGKELRLKKSFGTAMKLYDSKHAPAALGLYATIVFLGLTAIKQPELIEQFEEDRQLYAASEETGPLPSGNATVFSPQNPPSPDREHLHAIRLQAAEYLTRLDQGHPNPGATTSDESPVRLSPVNQSRYSEHRIFSQGRRRGGGPARVSEVNPSGVASTGAQNTAFSPIPPYSTSYAPTSYPVSGSPSGSQDSMSTYVPPGMTSSRGISPQPTSAAPNPGFYSTAQTPLSPSLTTEDPVAPPVVSDNDFRPRTSGYRSMLKQGPATIRIP